MTTARHDKQLRTFAIDAAKLLRDRHFEDIRLLDVRGLSQVCDFVLVASGISDRQMKSVAAELEDLGAEHDHKVYRSSRDEGGTWIVIDFVNMVTHLFEPQQRAYYDIETLWPEAEVVEWERSSAKASTAVKKVKKKAAPAARVKKKTTTTTTKTTKSKATTKNKQAAGKTPRRK